MEKIIELPEGIFHFQIEKDRAILLQCEVKAGAVMVPAQADGLPVEEIAKKAFFGQRNLRQVILPDSIQNIEDWAFASCRNLENVEFLGDQAELGKNIFQNCRKLQRVLRKNLPDDIACLLGAVPRYMPELYLKDIRDAESESWMERWDTGIVRRIRESDEEGFADQFICGLENFGQQDKDSYLEDRRREKSELAYIRLLHPYGLSDNLKMRIQRYLIRHSKGCASEAAWKVLLEKHGNDMAYAKLYREIFRVEDMPDVTPEQKIFHLDAHLKDIGDSYPELKAYLLKPEEKKESVADFFKDLSLDFQL